MRFAIAAALAFALGACGTSTTPQPRPTPDEAGYSAAVHHWATIVAADFGVETNACPGDQCVPAADQIAKDCQSFLDALSSIDVPPRLVSGNDALRQGLEELKDSAKTVAADVAQSDYSGAANALSRQTDGTSKIQEATSDFNAAGGLR